MSGGASLSRMSDGRVIGLSGSALSTLMPLHIWIGADGLIAHVGSTLARILPGTGLERRPLFDAVVVLRPAPLCDLADLSALQGQRIKLRLSDLADQTFTAMVVAQADGSLLLNLSFGASIADAVARYDLTLRDFAPTELTAELLFLKEAKSATLQESRALNLRLDGAKRRAQELSLTDTLTGLRNRRAMDGELGALTRDGPASRFGLMHVDLDHFKAVNDTFGHAAGDHVLLVVAEVLQSETRKDDVVCRVGGDEFVLVMKDCDDLKLLDAIARRIIARLEQPIVHEGEICRISASIGTTVSSFYNAPVADQMLSDADAATYQSKAAGRAQHTLFDPETRQSAALH